jgi:hypothetical protein
LIKRMADFQRVHLAAGASTTVTFSVPASFFNLVATESGNVVSTPGSYQLLITNGVDQVPPRVARRPAAAWGYAHLVGLVGVQTMAVPATLSGSEVVIEAFPQP